MTEPDSRCMHAPRGDDPDGDLTDRAWTDAIVTLAREAIARTLDVTPVEHYRQPDIPDAVWPEVKQRAAQVIEVITPDLDDARDALRTVTQV